MAPADILQTVFGFAHFRPGQADVIEHVLAGRSAAAVFPTGSGKSLCYQLPALLLPGLTLVVSPLRGYPETLQQRRACIKQLPCGNEMQGNHFEKACSA